MNAATYSPKPSSLAEKVIDFFRRNPTEELTRRDMADKFGCMPTSIDNCLVTAVANDYIATTNNDEMVRVWVAGPALTNGPTPIPVFGKVKPAAATRKERAPSPQLPPFDPATVKIEQAIPKPHIRFGQTGAYSVLIDRMRPGDSVQLPIAHAKRMCDWAKKRALNSATPQRWSARKVDADNARVWRDA